MVPPLYSDRWAACHTAPGSRGLHSRGPSLHATAGGRSLHSRGPSLQTGCYAALGAVAMHAIHPLARAAACIATASPLCLTCTVRRGRRASHWSHRSGATGLVQLAGAQVSPAGATWPGVGSRPRPRRPQGLAWLLHSPPAGCSLQPAGHIKALKGIFAYHTGPASAGPALCLPHRAN